MATGETWCLGHRPALDGLRGVAVLLVVLHHAELLSVESSWLGPAGVTIFFVLSGFLITGLLVAEWERRHTIDLLAFARRRAARLLPALFVMLAFVLGIGLVDLSTAAWPALYVGNWYAAAGGDLGPLLHTWSLSVEEQFYVAFPLLAWIALRLRGRRGLLVVTIAVAALSLAVRFGLSLAGAPHERIYFATDTQASSLLLGCALGAYLAEREPVGARPRAVLLALVVVIGVSLAGVGDPTVLVSLCAVACIHGCVAMRSGWLTASWLRLVGRRSYGLYLWHVPAFWLVGHLPIPRWSAVALAVSAAWLVALLSWRYIEAPFLRRPRTPDSRRAEISPGSARTDAAPAHPLGSLG